MCSAVWSAHSVRDRGVAGSNPATPTIVVLESGCSRAWLRRSLWERKTGGSNPSIPTILVTKAKADRITKYGAAPKRCQRCDKCIPYERRADTYCCVKCARNSDEAKAHARSIAVAGGLASGRKRQVADEDYAINMRLSSYKSAAKRRGFSFELTRDEFIFLISSPCWFCGSDPAPTWRHPKLQAAPHFNGVDRLVNKEGYTAANSVSCCGPCNRAKHTQGLQEFIDRAVRIAKRHGTDFSS